MFDKIALGWLTSLALICGGVAACNGADVPESATEEVGSITEDLRACGLCGGPFDVSCAEGSYCQSKPGKCPDAKHFGRCAVQPTACTKEYAPVCGCDGITYGNSCEAAAAGVSVASKGECEPTGGTFCGGIAGIPCPEGQTCVDAPDDGCDPANGGADCGGICVDAPTGTFCGGIAAIPCPKGQSCVDAPGDGCDPANGGADCGGICVDQCGDVTCAPGTTCCNPLRNICTRPGFACIQ